MGDAGEGLVDAQARMEERMDELARERAARGRARPRDPVAVSRVESLRLARIDLQRQADATTNPKLKAVRSQALSDLDRQLVDAQAALRLEQA